jgi:hypothetical protein
LPGHDQPLFPKLTAVVEAVLFVDFAEPSEEMLRSAWTNNDLEVIARQRLASLALRMVRTHSLDLPRSYVAALRTASFAASSKTFALTQASARALAALGSTKIPFVVSKGPGVALVCRSLSDRPFTDLDVLVAPADFGRALREMAALGYVEEPQSRPPWPWFCRYCMEAVNLRNPDGGSIDLHHHVPPWLWARELDSKLLIAAGEMRHFSGSDLPLLPPVYNLLVTALHVVSDHDRPGQTLMAWRDVVTLAHASSARDVVAAAEVSGLVGWLRWIIGELPDKVRPTGLWGILESSEAQPSSAFRLRRLLSPAFSSRHAVGHALRLPLANSSCYLAGMVVPSRKFLGAKLAKPTLPYFRWWQDCARRLLNADEDGSAEFRGNRENGATDGRPGNG